MLADAEEIDVEAVGQRALIHEVAQDLILGQQRAVRAKRDVAERVEAEGKGHRVPPDGIGRKVRAPGRSRNRAVCARSVGGLCATASAGGFHPRTPEDTWGTENGRVSRSGAARGLPGRASRRSARAPRRISGDGAEGVENAVGGLGRQSDGCGCGLRFLGGKRVLLAGIDTAVRLAACAASGRR